MPFAGVPQNGSFLFTRASSGLLPGHDLGALLTVALLMVSSPFGISHLRQVGDKHLPMLV